MSKDSCILPSLYWAPIQYFTKFLLFDNVEIEVFENYQKKSYRNRCEIYSANGKMSLNVPVEKSNGSKVVMKDVKIAYHTDWQKNHIKSMESAYSSSPFFEFYIDDILAIYEKKHKFLTDLNSDILQFCFEYLNIDKIIPDTKEYFECSDNNADYRESIHPKKDVYKLDTSFSPVKYMQGFEQRHNFIENLSILDLLCNTGSEAMSILKKSIS